MTREPLEDLINRALASGKWYGINMFADNHGSGPRVNLLRNISTAVCDQCTDPAVKPSERLRAMLETHSDTKPAPRVDNEIDDLLG